jgi:hypothetical protein
MRDAIRRIRDYETRKNAHRRYTLFCRLAVAGSLKPGACGVKTVMRCSPIRCGSLLPCDYDASSRSNEFVGRDLKIAPAGSLVLIPKALHSRLCLLSSQAKRLVFRRPDRDRTSCNFEFSSTFGSKFTCNWLSNSLISAHGNIRTTLSRTKHATKWRTSEGYLAAQN